MTEASVPRSGWKEVKQSKGELTSVLDVRLVDFGDDVVFLISLKCKWARVDDHVGTMDSLASLDTQVSLEWVSRRVFLTFVLSST